MEYNTPEQLDSVINSLKHRRNAFSDTEMDSAISIVKQLQNFPTKTPPKPVRQFKYKDHPVAKPVFQWRKFLIFPTAAAFTLAGIIGTATASQNSLPGQKLFVVKRAVEQTQLAFTVDAETKAKLQLEITQKRASEAETIFNGPIRDPKLETAALAALTKQTEKTVNAVKVASSEKNASAKPLLVESLNKIQNELEGKSNNNIATATQDKDTVANIKKILAAVNDQSIITLTPQPITKIATGTVTSLKNDEITIGKVSYKILDRTEIKKENNPVTVQNIEIGTSVEIEYVVKPSEQIAEKITIQVVKNNSTSTTPSTGKSKDDIQRDLLFHQTKQSTTPEEISDILNSEQPKIQTPIIVEDPTPQYKP